MRMRISIIAMLYDKLSSASFLVSTFSFNVYRLEKIRLGETRGKIKRLGEEGKGKGRKEGLGTFCPRQAPGPRRNGLEAERLSVLSGSSQRSGTKESGFLKYFALRAET